MGDRQGAINLLAEAQRQQQLVQQGKPANVNLIFQYIASSCMADPTFALGWGEQGNSLQDGGLQEPWRRPSAVASYRRALELPDGKNVGDMTPDQRGRIMCNMAQNLHLMGQNEEAQEVVTAALKMDDKLAIGWLTLAMIHNVEGRLPEAISAAKRAWKLEQTPPIELAYAFALLFSGRYAEGLRRFNSRFAYFLRQFLEYPYPQWKGEPGKTLFLVTDQGIGDALSFSRFVPAAIERCKFVHIRVQPELVRLFQVLFQKYPNISIQPTPCPFPPADYWSTYMCLPTALGLTTDEIIDMPTLPCPQFTLPGGTAWKATDRKLHVGVAWAGSNTNWINHWRSFPVELLLEFYKVPGIQLYSLQVGDHAHDLHNIGAATLIRDLNGHIKDVGDTIAILRDLDLVISCESALPHICAIAGKEVWVPYSWHGGDWRLGRTEKGQLWNRNCRVFKQGKDASWLPVWSRMIEALRERVGAQEQRKAS